MSLHLFALSACGPDCWEARENVCRCSCGGARHGIRRPTCGPAILRPVTDSQIRRWPELAAWRAVSAHSLALYGRPQILWRRLDAETARVRQALNPNERTPAQS
jgi:hypothetical protein